MSEAPHACRDAWLPLRDLGPELADCTALAGLLGQIAPELPPVAVQGCARPSALPPQIVALPPRWPACLARCACGSARVLVCATAALHRRACPRSAKSMSTRSNLCVLESAFALRRASLPGCSRGSQGLRREPSVLARAERLLGAAAALTREPLPPARALAEGNVPLNAALLAALFRARPALDALAAADERSQLAAWLEECSLEARPCGVGCGLRVWDSRMSTRAPGTKRAGGGRQARAGVLCFHQALERAATHVC